MKPLYQLTEEFQNVWEAILEAAEAGDGSIPFELKSTLDGIESHIEAKLENCCKVLRDLQGRAEMCKSEEDRLAAQRKSALHHVEWLKGYVLDSLTKIGKTSLQAGIFKVRVQANSQATLTITDESKVPDDFWYQPPKKLSNEAVRKALEDGETVVGCALVKGQHLRIA